MRIIALLFMVFTTLPVAAQYAPQAGVAGSTAISKDDKRFVAWANACTVERGWLDIADKALGRATQGADNNVLGKPDNYNVSLGDSGTAVITFPGALYNGPGPDFAVFEYGFQNPSNPEESFMELAFVEVSSDGINYVRFDASALTDSPQVPMAGVYMNARKINNLAGKYINGYGTPFDLEELKGSPGLDVDKITHVRLVDVIGDIGANGSKDTAGNKINDPYPSAVPSGGFDLEAVGAINIPGWWPAAVNNETVTSVLKVYPNPATDVVNVYAPYMQDAAISIKDVTGRVLGQAILNNNRAIVDISHLSQGIYYLILTDANGKEWVERFARY